MTLVAILSCLAACEKKSGPKAKSPAAEREPLEVSQTRVFTGPEGFKLEVVDLADGDALIQITGYRSELTGKVFRYKVEEDDRYLRYQMTWHGRTRNLLVREHARVGDEIWWRAYPPGNTSGDGILLEYSEKLSPTVDAKAIHRTHWDQRESGVLAAIERFDRPAEEAEENQELAEEVERTAKTCGRAIPISVAWGTVTDDDLKEKSIAGYCGSLLYGLRDICQYEAGKRFIDTNVKSLSCRMDGSYQISLKGTALEWAISFTSVNLDRAAAEALRTLPVGQGTVTLGDQIFADQTAVCTDSNGKHVVMVGPRDAPHGGMAYGAGKTLYKVAVPQMLSDGWFFDPRQKNPGNNENFRGYDLRFFSHVDADTEKGTCSVTCGARTVALKLLTGKPKVDALANVKYEPSPHGREPYALARDNKGTYYYVDRGATAETERDFHLFRGQRGRMSPLIMRDVVSDSEGEIFASDSGKLRLVVGKKDAASWIGNEKSVKLTQVPLSENYGLIYNELGVYLGERLGVPCDDL